MTSELTNKIYLSWHLTNVTKVEATDHIWYIFMQNIKTKLLRPPKVKGHPWDNWHWSLFLNKVSIFLPQRSNV